MADIKTIALRGGHNELATGARALIDEVIEDRKVYKAVKKYLEMGGAKVIDVTPKAMDTNSDLIYGVDLANRNKVDLFVSIHFNKAYDKYDGAIGSEVCVFDKFAIAQQVCDKLGELGFKNRGQKVNKGLYELKATNMRAMVVECLFCEATKDVELYKKLGADKLGKAIAEGILGKTISAPKPPTASKPKQGYIVTNPFKMDEGNKVTHVDFNKVIKCLGTVGYYIKYLDNGKGIRIHTKYATIKTAEQIAEKLKKIKMFDEMITK